jgi:sporulation protein YlmC with PRC-barrel domain
MKSARFLNVITELIGSPVGEAETGATLGAVTDVVVHPTDGDIMGLLLLTNQGRQAAIATGHFQFNERERKICTMLDALLIGNEIELYLGGGVNVCGDLLACEVVTHEGKLLGLISEAYVAVAQPPQLIYRIAEPGLLRLLRRSFYLAADEPYFYSGVEHRLFVPAIPAASLLCHSLAEAASKAPPREMARESTKVIKQVAR